MGVRPWSWQDVVEPVRRYAVTTYRLGNMVCIRDVSPRATEMGATRVADLSTVHTGMHRDNG